MSTPPPSLWTPAWQRARRGWLQLLLATTALAAAGGGWWARQSRQAGDPPQTVAELEAAMLERIVDIVVPRDETPGAVELGVHTTVQQEMLANTPLLLACSELFQALDRSARAAHGKGFLYLLAADQDAQLQALALAGAGSTGWPALMHLRERTLQLYYAQPASWPSLGLAGAPQPLGFMDYTQPPKPRA